MTLSEKGKVFANAMVEFENTLSKSQMAKLEEVLNLQVDAHDEEMEKLVDWCVNILKK